jgi:hypothetical protein
MNIQLDSDLLYGSTNDIDNGQAIIIHSYPNTESDS